MGYFAIFTKCPQMSTFKNLPILPIFDPLKLRKCVYAVGGLTAQTKDTSLYLFKKSVNMRIFDHWSSYSHPKVTQIT